MCVECKKKVGGAACDELTLLRLVQDVGGGKARER